ncbi:hypothetical protein [Neorhizobium tomejilense]|uniref:hypothetical protein n=1 Tax=Neorhizobium tomejilense TaxID=2093828 RepID=UPI001FDFD0B8|nr:hypothetical protein [Neorhizobium tomejilense]
MPFMEILSPLSTGLVGRSTTRLSTPTDGRLPNVFSLMIRWTVGCPSAQDLGFMCLRSFADPDGHIFEPAYMDMNAAG